MKYLYLGLLVVGLLIPIAGNSQQTDTVTLLELDTFLDIVKKNHPVSLQAELLNDDANAALLGARGAFDPKLYADVSEKDFDEKDYYQLIDAGLSIPTWLGLDFKTGFERGRGLFLNPQNNTPTDNGLLFAGVTVPVGQGLFIDKRRADVRQARILQENNEAERTIVLNNLLLEAGNTYWDWAQAYGAKRIFEDALALAQQRFEAVKVGARIGDLAPIDTVEASLQVQIRFVDLQQANLDFANATAELAVFLWADGIVPLEITAGTVPFYYEDLVPLPVMDNYITLMDTLIQIHPELQQSQLKINSLLLDRRLKKEEFKPVVNLSYKPITEPVGGAPLGELSENNFTWGLTFSFPLLLRKARGSVQQASIKVKNAEFDLENKSQMLFQKAQIALNEWETTFTQTVQYEQTVGDYFRLLEAERQRFDAGESSLFLVNSRETSFINAKVKQVEFSTKNRKAILKTDFAFGVLSQELNPITQ
ncbi:MAG: TolC family protein [Bacteroidota bacterium]